MYTLETDLHANKFWLHTVLISCNNAQLSQTQDRLPSYSKFREKMKTKRWCLSKSYVQMNASRLVVLKDFQMNQTLAQILA